MRNKTTLTFIKLLFLSLMCGLFPPFGGIEGGCQDIHFTQANMTPLLVNPANAGSEYTIRGILNYRSQWGSVSEPFTTMMASYDMNFKTARNSKTGYFAGGIYLFSDKAGASQMKTNQVNLSGAYHINLNSKNTLGLGVQGGYFQRSANTNNLTWGSQFDGYEYNQTYSTGESPDFTGISFGSADFTSGLVWTYRNDEGYLSGKKMLINSGFSLHHLTKPEIETQALVQDELHYRWIFHTNAIVGLNEKYTVLPYFLFSRQGTVNEIMFGSDVLYMFKQASKYTKNNKGMAVGMGAFYRWNDAIILSTMLQYDSYTIAFSYDINSSSLNEASNKRGAYELAIRYVYPNPFGGIKSKSRFN